MTVRLHHLLLDFYRPAQTSRDTLHTKDTWLLLEYEGDRLIGAGEASPIWGLSPEPKAGYREALEVALAAPEAFVADRANWAQFPSLVFGIETLLHSRTQADPATLFDTPFLHGQGQPINGLIWMGDLDFMRTQIEEKLAEGFRCLKLKIGALNWDDEHALLQALRKRFPAEVLEIRVDANGAFTDRDPMGKLQALAALDIHSIEQPIAAGHWSQMAALCAHTPLPIALDEELIGVGMLEEREALLDTTRPHYLILKPSLLGGWASCDEWIALAEARGIGWWATSALESNVGLNAIAQWVATHAPSLPQGLGTGKLYRNNLQSPLWISSAEIYHSQNGSWEWPAKPPA